MSNRIIISEYFFNEDNQETLEIVQNILTSNFGNTEFNIAWY